MTRTIIDHLWQSTLCVAIAWLLTLALRNNAARIRYWVWFAVSLKFLMPFSLLTFLGSQFSWRGADAPMTAETQSFISFFHQIAEPLATPAITLREPMERFNWLWLGVALWALGSIALLARWFVNWKRVSAAVQCGVAIDVAAPIEVRSTAAMLEPGIVGIAHPVLLLPDGIADRLTPQQLQAVIAHELCHVRRRDNLTAAIHMVVEALFWFHPLVWWIGARLVEERERACDEGVVELGNEPQTYAEGILKVCQFYLESKLACVAGVAGANLKKRVEVIMSNRSTIEFGAAKRFGLTSIFVLIVAVPIASGMLIDTHANGANDSASGSASIENLRIEAFESRSTKPLQKLNDLELYQPGQTIRSTIAPAYQIQPRQIINAPAWIDTVRYDKYLGGSGLAPDGMARLNQYALLERRLLADQFELKFHREIKLVPVYVLSISDRGRAEKLREVAPVDTGLPIKQSIVLGGPESFPQLMVAAPVHHFVSRLSWVLDSIVLDRTGLEGRYRFEFSAEPTADALPEMLDREFGLTLSRGTENVEMFVVDSIKQPMTRLALQPGPVRASQSGPMPATRASPAVIQSPGERLNMRFRDKDVREVFQVLAMASGKRIVVHPSISGPVTVAFNNVTWDEALTEIAAAKRLAIRRDENAINIDPPTY